MTAHEPTIDQLIRKVGDRRVILDFDLARLYGTSTKRFNEAFKRNRDRFPQDFAFQLSQAEWASLNWSQNATSCAQPFQDKAVATEDPLLDPTRHRGRSYRPWAFTEHGCLMAANILRSPRARAMSAFIIRAFVKMREGLAANAAILKRLSEIDRSLLLHDSALRDLYQKLLPLLEPPSESRKSRIGFHQGNR